MVYIKVITETQFDVKLLLIYHGNIELKGEKFLLYPYFLLSEIPTLPYFLNKKCPTFALFFSEEAVESLCYTVCL